MQHPDEGTLHAWLDGELEARHAADIEAHVAQCAACSAAIAEARGFRSTSDRLIEVLEPEPTRAPMRPTATRSDPARRGPRWKVWIAPLAAAAVLVLVVQLNRDRIASLSDAAAPEAASAPSPLAAPAASTDSSGNRGQGYAQPAPEEERALMQEKKGNAAADAAKAKDENAPAATEGAPARRDAGQAAGLRAPESAAQAGREPGKELGDLPTWKPQTVGESGQARDKEIGDLPNWKPQVLPEGAAAPMPPGTVNAVKEALGGPMRVIEGLKPAQVQVLPATAGTAATVRTTYMDGGSPVTLEQRRVTSAEADAVKRAEAPTAPPANSRNAMAGAVASVNQLTWRDGDYEFLLQGPVSSDSLKVLKQKVK